MDIIIVEKRVSIGEVNNQTIWTWEFFDAVKSTKIKEWCSSRGFIIPKFGVEMYVHLEENFRCRLWEI